MDGMNIVAGDLESLAQESACVAEDIIAKKVEAAFGDASSAMPGSESSKLISETGDSVDKRIMDLSDKYTDFTEKVKANLCEYQQNEGSIQGAMDSLGSSSPAMSGAGGVGAGAAAGAAVGKIASRMGGGSDLGVGAAAGAAAGVAGGHSYGSTVGGAGGHSYGSTVGGAAGHSYGSVVEGSTDGLIGGSDGSVVEPIPTSPGDYSIDPIPNADPSGPFIENLSATNEGTV